MMQSGKMFWFRAATPSRSALLRSRTAENLRACSVVSSMPLQHHQDQSKRGFITSTTNSAHALQNQSPCNTLSTRTQSTPQLRFERSVYHENQQRRGMSMVSQHKAGDSPEVEIPKVVVTQAASNAELPNSSMSLNITESCWKRIQQLAKKRKKSLSDIYLRVYVDAGGCSGFSYKFEMDTPENLEDDDIIITQQSDSGEADEAVPRVVVDPSSLEYIQGSTIDFVQEMIKSSFEVRENPQSESACGCGSSFALKNFSANPAKD